MRTSLVLGFFDGVHIGHQAVIESAVNFKIGNKVVLLTLNDSPAKFFGKPAEYIFSRENSIKKLKLHGVDEVVADDFDKVHRISAEEYLNSIIKKYNPESVSTGFNYTFGFNKTGTPDFLKKYDGNFTYICTPPVTIDNEIVSSTLIKNCLKSGDIKKANKLLGSNFILEGTIIQGNKLGRQIGFPTANFDYPKEIVKIPFGAYIIKTDKHLGIMNYGVKPTVTGKNKPIVEVHLINFQGDLYGKKLTVNILEKIRDEKKFSRLEDLKIQLQKDKEECLKLLS
ncbi:riboflavin biosynthesis protein RibF [bacterium]|nr:riboflavin biosynthesis protein RibF [bacterium]